MKKFIGAVFLFVTTYIHVGVDIYIGDATILGLEKNEKTNLTTSTLLGGNDYGAASIADCSLVNSKCKK